MVYQYCRIVVRRYLLPALVIASVLVFAAAQSYAYTEEKSGYFMGFRNNRITMEAFDGRGTDRFDVTDQTKVINAGVPMKLKWVTKHSRVKVVYESGVALEIWVLEVPK